jgi:hypothetical protein
VSAVAPAEVVERIWARDATLWTGHDEAKWLGWLDEPMRMRSRQGDLLRFVEELAAPGVVDTFVLLGMGGSSLAPEVIRRTFESDSFHVLDTTHPAALRRATEALDFDATLFVAASKSGTTLETRCHLDYFCEKAGKRGELFAAITDPGSELESLARERGFLGIFDGEPTIGGRYSALSIFGLVPATLMGVDLERLLERVEEMVEACHAQDGNPGLELGLELGEGWQDGRDKVTINPNTGGFGLWAEQLLAESTGKEGKGLIPAPGEPPDGPDRQAPEVRLSALRARSGVLPLGVRPRWRVDLGINRSTSPTCRRRRTRRGGPPGWDALGGSLWPSLPGAPATTSRSRFIDPGEAELEPLVERAPDRVRRHPQPGPRHPHRPASCTKVARTHLFVRRWTIPKEVAIPAQSPLARDPNGWYFRQRVGGEIVESLGVSSERNGGLGRRAGT